MKLVKVKKVILMGIMLACSVKVMAADDKVVCPSMNLVKQSWMLLDTVIRATPPKFVISTTTTTLLDLEHRAWNIVTYADADSMDAAFKAGQEIVKNISEVKEKYATDMKDVYLCLYKSPGAVFGVGLISDKTENNNDFKITSINLNLLK